MPRPISIGAQDFEFLRSNNCFYIDKTDFIRDWWEQGTPMTVITRPHHFGKTLMMDTVACFFSNARQDQLQLFGNLAVWKSDKMRALAGTRPVISLTFSGIKGNNFQETRRLIGEVINDVYAEFRWLQDSPALSLEERRKIESFSPQADDVTLELSLRNLSQALHKHFKVKPLILLADE